MIKALTKDAVSLLKGMVAIPSLSFNEDQVCSFICKWMDKKGLVYKRVGNNILARLSEQAGMNKNEFEGKPTLMLCAHIDTVSPSNEYSFDPYNPDYTKAAEVIGSDDIVPGLGSNDDGASVVSMLATFIYLTSICGTGVKNDPSHDDVVAARCKGPLDHLLFACDPCGQGGSTVF
jgi:acetylornithine deacetylase